MKLEAFVMEEMERGSIKLADYNPRKISKPAMAKLKKGIVDHGLVAPVVYNKRTGTLVGGHQRIAAMDSLNKGTKYKLQVAVIDVDEKEEREINILLNNPDLMGSWNLDKLREIVKSVKLERTGFSGFDMQVLMNDPGFSPFAKDNGAEAAAREVFEKSVQTAEFNLQAAMAVVQAEDAQKDAVVDDSEDVRIGPDTSSEKVDGAEKPEREEGSSGAVDEEVSETTPAPRPPKLQEVINMRAKHQQKVKSSDYYVVLVFPDAKAKDDAWKKFTGLGADALGSASKEGFADGAKVFSAIKEAQGGSL